MSFHLSTLPKAALLLLFHDLQRRNRNVDTTLMCSHMQVQMTVHAFMT